jgi:hypothetical protein
LSFFTERVQRKRDDLLEPVSPYETFSLSHVEPYGAEEDLRPAEVNGSAPTFEASCSALEFESM